MRNNLCLCVVFILSIGNLFCQNKEEVISLLHNIDMRSTRYGNKIAFIEEFNFGISGGINWLVQWYQEYDNGIYTFIYVVDIDSKEIKFRDQVGVTSRDVPP